MKLQHLPQTRPGYADLHEHIQALQSSNLLFKIDEPVNKDTELHPLVRWQFRGGIPERDRRAFLFTNVIDGLGRRYKFPVVVGALAANAEIYSIGMGVPLDKIGETWRRAIANPIPPNVIEHAPSQEVVITGSELLNEGNGLDALPIPISTPGFDSAPYLTATCCITADPKSRLQNMGTYRAALKAPDRLAVKMFVNLQQGGYAHWLQYRERGEKMPMAIVLGSPPVVTYCGPQKIAENIDEIAVAGGIAGVPIEVIRAKSVDLLVPAHSEVVIEGLIDTEFLEPEGPFGESHGHVNLEEYNFMMTVTTITRRHEAIIPSIISQVTPSESSVIKRVAYEPLFLEHLRDHLGIGGILRVSMHEPLTNLRPVIVIQVERDIPQSDVWRALYAASSFQRPCGKYVIAVNEDINPYNSDAVFWAMSYRANPEIDTHILRHQDPGHGPPTSSNEASSLLINATLQQNAPPVSLPTRNYMVAAKKLWERLDLPTLRPEVPWHGYSLGQWSEEWDASAERAAAGHYLENGHISYQKRRADIPPNSPLTGPIDPGKNQK